MSLVMVAHSLTGTVVVCSGMLALLLRKGSAMHKFAGRVFVGSLVFMGPVVVAELWLQPGGVSPLGIIFVFFIVYLVGSAWVTIHKPERTLVFLDYAAPVVALCIAIAGVAMGLDAIDTPSEGNNLPPQEAYFFFAALALVALLLDTNNIRLGGVRGKHRIGRHVWRMTCALFFATSTLFTGPGSVVFPESIRGSLVLSFPQYLVAILALVWMYRLLFSGPWAFSNVLTANLASQEIKNSQAESNQT